MMFIMFQQMTTGPRIVVLPAKLKEK